RSARATTARTTSATTGAPWVERAGGEATDSGGSAELTPSQRRDLPAPAFPDELEGVLRGPLLRGDERGRRAPVYGHGPEGHVERVGVVERVGDHRVAGLAARPDRVDQRARKQVRAGLALAGLPRRGLEVVDR